MKFQCKMRFHPTAYAVGFPAQIIVKRGRPADPDVFYYLDAVEEALCFGWIDSTYRKCIRKSFCRCCFRISAWSRLCRSRRISRYR